MITKSERLRAQKNKRSLRQAVNWMCKDCIYDSHEVGTWKHQTQACTTKSCPLWYFRPKSIGKTNRANR